MGRKNFPCKPIKEQVKNSPGIDTQKTVLCQKDINDYCSSIFIGAADIKMMIETYELIESNLKKKLTGPLGYTNFRSIYIVNGYCNYAIDGCRGDVEDFIFEDTFSRIDFMVVDIAHWFFRE